MAICRVYLCTYRRNELLPRALKSLINQTFKDWVCELHNDDPNDPFPRKIVNEINDPRIQIVDHITNMGPMPVFNLVFKPVEEEFVSLLEDDNWWEPNFLEHMVAVMRSNPTVKVAWANMRFWQENDDGSWSETGKKIWERAETDPVEFFYWPDQRQIFGALHSQGAMLVRSSYASRYQVPNETTSAAGEHLRERVFDYPILFVPQTLGNYALTKGTSRSQDRSTWAAIQVLLGGSFFKHVPIKDETLQKIWLEARTQVPQSTGHLILTALTYSECRYLLKYTTIKDYIFFIASMIKHPWTTLKTWKLIKSSSAIYSFLDQQTALKLKEAQEYGFECL